MQIWFITLRGWAQEYVEEHSEEHKDNIGHDTQPETRILKELLVVGTEEDVANGHSCYNSSKMSHKGHLQKKNNYSAITKAEWNTDPPPPPPPPPTKPSPPLPNL